MVAGSSAGAMVMGARMWGFDDGWLEGLGLAAGVVIVPHHASNVARWQVGRISEGLPEGVTLLGIDEATAAYGDGGGRWQVAGADQVTVYAGGEAVAYADGGSFGLSG